MNPQINHYITFEEAFKLLPINIKKIFVFNIDLFIEKNKED